ncbi:MAG: phosphopantetheine-binding protein [Actinomycetota bacterium]|nr:phosphopantetheine-binding protein [Actinomycetota bacterium]
MNPVEAPTKKWTQNAIEALVLELLAEQMGEDQEALTMRLQEKGQGMPIDSLEMFDMLAEFRKKTALKIPVKKLKKNTLRSVRAFAEFAAKEGS